jgi:hypothetical protein
MAATTTAGNPLTSTAGEIGVGAAGLGVLGALGAFGGAGNVTNPYAGQATSAFGNATTNAGLETAAGEDLTNTGEQTLSQYGAFQPQADQATENELAYLNTNPYTDTYSQAQLSHATGGAMQGYAQAKSALASQLGARGIGGPGSSALAGADAGIDAAEAGTLAGNQNAIALQAIQQRGQNLGLANQVAAQHSGSLFSQGTGATEAGAGEEGQAGQIYDQAGMGYENLGQQQIQDTINGNNGASSAWAGLAGIGLKAAGL